MSKTKFRRLAETAMLHKDGCSSLPPDQYAAAAVRLMRLLMRQIRARLRCWLRVSVARCRLLPSAVLSLLLLTLL